MPKELFMVEDRLARRLTGFEIEIKKKEEPA